MRLWSLHPSYLDSKGLVALWREGLLARKVLSGQTRGYRKHPQLTRFKISVNPSLAIEVYLVAVYAESLRRGYQFDATKISFETAEIHLRVTRGQLQFEWKHLLHKLLKRAPLKYREVSGVKKPGAHPLFTVVPGKVEQWEKID